MYRPEYSYMEIVVGPMFSGKSEELIRRVKRAVIANREVMVFKPQIDNRYSKEDVASHSGQIIKAYPVRDSKQLEKLYIERKTGLEKENKNITIVAIDEVQFFDKDIIKTVEKLVTQGVLVIMSGLDQDFKGEPFPITAELMARSEFVTKLHSVCMKCGRPAVKSQRIIDGKPARVDDPIIKIGAKESYEPRCRSCHIVLKGENNEEN